MIGLIWGSGGNSVNLGEIEHKHCEICERERPFAIVLQYRYAHVYWIFSWITEEHYSLLCTICSRGWELNAKEIKKTLTKDPIPFIRRWGWSFIVAPVAFLLIINLISSIFTAIFGR
jgi:hypothetical protein